MSVTGAPTEYSLKRCRHAVAALLLLLVAPAVGQPAPESAQDLKYGSVLYEYYQDNVFDALTLLEVAQSSGGVQGHGRHPALLEGGLMLSWGMTGRAREMFRMLLDGDASEVSVSEGARNQAWFFLGKVLYLEDDLVAARNALEQVELLLLHQQDPQFYREWHYLSGQIALKIGIGNFQRSLQALDGQQPWQAYLIFNQALSQLEDDDAEQAMATLERLVELPPGALENRDPVAAQELRLLKDEARLLLARLGRRLERYQQALDRLEQVSESGPLYARAQYEVAVTASLMGKPDRALAALATLERSPLPDRGSFPIAYARGMVFEQLGRDEQAVDSYARAAETYQALRGRLEQERDSLTEAGLLSLLEFNRPESYRLAGLVTGTDFRKELSEFRELKRLERHFARWQDQLESFEDILETRDVQRQERAEKVRQALQAVSANGWQEKLGNLRQRIETAIAEEDAEFFMSSEQMVLAERIRHARERLAELPDTVDTSDQEKRLERVEAYFAWTVSDDYSVNRWAAEKQLKELDRAMSGFLRQRASLEQELATDSRTASLRDRVQGQRQALEELGSELDQAMSRTREALMSRVMGYYQQQQERVSGYRLASRHGAARLADEAYRQDADPTMLSTAVSQYRLLLPLLEDPEQKASAEYRLADLLLEGAVRQFSRSSPRAADEAVAAYQALLERYPERPENDQVYYQLARAWALQGETGEMLESLTRLVERYPDSPYLMEASFRIGDQQFINGQYQAAETAFDRVIDAAGADPNASDFLRNARYMKGWSQYHQGSSRESLRSFAVLMDDIFGGSQVQQSADVTPDQFGEEVLRVFALILSQLDGAESLQALFDDIGARPWERRIYDYFGEDLVSREQYTDAVNVFEGYAGQHPQSQLAPRYRVRALEVLETAGFSGSLAESQADFVDRYGISGTYLTESATPETRAFIREQLEQLLPELATYHHQSARLSDDQAVATGHLLRAERYYLEFIETFPKHPQVSEQLFLLAESRLDREDWPGAIEIFERLAYETPDISPERMAEAGYAVVLAYRDLAQGVNGQAPDTPMRELEQAQQENRLQFAETFPADPRAADVYYTAMQHEFEKGNYPVAIEMADRLLNWQPEPDDELLTEAWVVKAHGYYEQQQYPRAETAYQEALLRLPQGNARYRALSENLAASVYRQAESDIASGRLSGAVDQLLRVGSVAGGSALAATARLEAVGYLMDLQAWDRAIPLMQDLRQQSDDTERRRNLTAQLALAYRESGQFEKAAEEVIRLYEQAEDPEARRANLLTAAELYDRAGVQGQAILTYRSYANRYPQPLTEYMESANRLADLYKETGQELKRNYWLERQMEAVDRNRDEASERAVELAAKAAVTVADQALYRYNQIRLTLPLNRSMVAKTEALEKAVAAYQRASAYGVAEVSTEAGYRIADIYARLGKDLMDSERPSGLSELEAAQYDLLLEEQAYPFEDSAIDIHEQNASRARRGLYDQWVKRSYEALSKLLPGRYNKQEITRGVVREFD